jgi:hypothetical protein
LAATIELFSTTGAKQGTRDSPPPCRGKERNEHESISILIRLQNSQSTCESSSKISKDLEWKLTLLHTLVLKVPQTTETFLQMK